MKQAGQRHTSTTHSDALPWYATVNETLSKHFNTRTGKTDHRMKRKIILSSLVLFTLCTACPSTVSCQSIGYSGGFCVGSPVDFYITTILPCGEANVSSASDWKFDSAPTTITFPTPGNYN